MKHVIQITQQFTRNGDITEAFDEFLDRVLDDFYDRGVDADYLATVSKQEVIWTVTVDADDRLSALIDASSSLRTALHAAGASTNGWATLDDLRKAVEVRDADEDLASA
ncbi:hypothetical protein ACT3SZ_14550 [Corynebacterium sp. AOP40-9SA-29]|uniref:hypothetical protein n=1 Tax=Corynebacterium sp. AOP40-9SA-29 TaxID=3457677 RepID=UPI0040338A2A